MMDGNYVIYILQFIIYFRSSCSISYLKKKNRYVIYVKEGIYDETVVITKKMVNVTMYGDGSQKSMISGSKNFVDGVRTFQTATFGNFKH